jgi:Macrocin-O-methyltransferase (TylF)
MPTLLSEIKSALTIVGTFVPRKTVDDSNKILNYLAVGRWMKDNHYNTKYRLPCRERIFNLIANDVANKRVLYMEFGVFDGRATRYWSMLLRHPESHLHGFDSFEGLPESWEGTDRDKGYFSTKGAIPQIDDVRVRFFKGWFQDTLPTYEAPPHDVLIINLDADLYSSTAYVLSRLRDLIVPGTYIYFDEFNHRFHEMRAFDEFIRETGMKFLLVGATNTLEHVAFCRPVKALLRL